MPHRLGEVAVRNVGKALGQPTVHAPFRGKSCSGLLRGEVGHVNALNARPNRGQEAVGMFGDKEHDRAVRGLFHQLQKFVRGVDAHHLRKPANPNLPTPVKRLPIPVFD